jgi:hypothetical protein
MQLFSRRSDQEYVESLRRGLQQRQAAGTVVFLLGAVMLAAATWYVARIVPTVNEDAHALNDRDGRTGIGRLVSYYDGLATGHVVTLVWLLGAYFLCLGVGAWAGGRTERLLVTYFDRLDALGQLPPSSHGA